MATIIPINGKWRATVRKKQGGKLVLNKTKTFDSKKLAEDWAKRLEVKVQDDGGLKSVQDTMSTRGVLVSTLIQKYMDYVEAVKPLGETKKNVLKVLRDSTLGQKTATGLKAQDLIDYCMERHDLYGNGPATLYQYVGYFRQVFAIAPSAWGIAVTTTAIDEAKPVLTHLGLIGQGNERDRRLEGDEYQRLLEWFTEYDRGRAREVEMLPVFRFAVALPLRRGEICGISRRHLDIKKRTVIIKDRKDPKKKIGNDQEVPLLGEAWDIVQAQLAGRAEGDKEERIFPYNVTTVSAVFQRAVESLGIEDLHFHDLRHEGTSRLFEAGYSIEEVALVTGHKNWNTLRRYTQLRPASLHHKPAAANLGGTPVAPLESKRAVGIKRKVWIVKTPDGYLHPLEDGMGYVESEGEAWGWLTADEAQDALEGEGGAGELLRVLMPVS
ncbi:site-specific integrase [Chromobacterium sp. S0633]|uniref:site-specific integrase n=1 Tax=Chromobacterium sp. S0633 TaxID=2957805 RepID=UPI00209EFD20|nr:site-specific integrase [Chromobacterium sp. S0633]MCP1290894.1 site-specific integrase [Chromobacterium sp. S0633]